MAQSGEEKILAAHELKALEQVAQTDPTSPALLALVRAFLTMDKVQEASALAGRIFAAHPDHLEAAVLTAEALRAEKKTEEAQRVLKQAAGSLKNLAQVLARLARLFEATGWSEAGVRTSQASSALTGLDLVVPAEEKKPEEPAAETDIVPTATLAALYVAQGHLDKAVQVYEALLRRNPGNPELQEKLADLKIRAAGVFEEFGPTAPAMTVEPPLPQGRAEMEAGRGPKIEKEKAGSARVELLRRLERLKAAAGRRRLYNLLDYKEI